MYLRQASLRSYRSFNFDYKKKLQLDETTFLAHRAVWEEDRYTQWRPWVRVPFHREITTIVGLNESGKSHLVGAISCVMNDRSFAAADVCRYSPEGDIRTAGVPRVALHWEGLSDRLQGFLQQFAPGHHAGAAESEQQEAGDDNAPPEDSDSAAPFESLVVIKGEGERSQVFAIPPDDEPVRLSIEVAQYAKLREFLPRCFTVDPKCALPATVDIKQLIKLALQLQSDATAGFLERHSAIISDEKALSAIKITNQGELTFDLLRRCASLDVAMLEKLLSLPDHMLRDYSEQATRNVEEWLNLSHWWAQDIDIRLTVEFHKDRVAFSLTDRTQTWYSFDERSSGLQHFLGYLLQILLEHERDDGPFLALLDEPDFSLSAVGQRDVLRFFRRIVELHVSGCQIVYTTHSPELIDPNYPARIVVLRKGLYDEGTTVVAKVHQRLFEPVRTALGARATALPFIDGPNLLVEGETDRIFIVRMSQYLAERRMPHLDLGYLSILVADGCSRMPRIVLAARGLAGDRAYMTVLIDNDDRGREAAKAITEADSLLEENKQILHVNEVLESGLNKDTEIEDLVPPELYLKSVRRVVARDSPETATARLTLDALRHLADSGPLIDAVNQLLSPPGEPKLTFDKRAVMEDVFDQLEQAGGHDEFVALLGLFTSQLRERINDNLRRKRHEEISRTIGALVRHFRRAHSEGVTKRRASELLEQMRELGNRIAAPGTFDTEIEAVAKTWKLRGGIQSDAIDDAEGFFNRVAQLRQKLTIDEELDPMDGS